MAAAGAGRGKGRAAGAAILAAILLAMAMPASAAPELPPRAADLLKSPDGSVPDRLAGFALVTAFAGDWGARYLFTLDAANPQGANLVELVLSARDGGRPSVARTRSFDVGYKGPTEGGAPAARVLPLVEAFVAAVERNDVGPAPGASPRAAPGATAPGAGGDSTVAAPPPDDAPFAPVLSPVVAGIGIGLVVLFLLTLPWVSTRAWRDLRVALGPWLWPVLAVVAAGIAARLLVPHRPVMYYMGYRMAEVAAAFDDIPKYGPGALALYHLLFLGTGPSHLAMAFLNSVLGGLLPIAAAGLVARLSGGRVAVAAAAVLVAATPAFVRDSATESLLVPSLLWTATGLWLLLRWRSTRGGVDLALSAVALLLACLSRPEAVGLVPLAAAALFPLAPPGDGRTTPRARAIAGSIAGVSAAILALRLAHLAVSVNRELALGNTPVLADPGALLALVPDLLSRNLALRPAWFPVGVTAAALLPVLLGPRRVRGLVLVGLSVAWLAVSLVDLPHVSLPRVQVPGLLFLALSAAFGLESAWGRRGRGVPGRAMRLALGVGTTAAIAASLPFSGAAFAERTNADDEEDFLRDAFDALPAGPVVFVRRSYDDQPVERLHLHYPDYRLRPPFRDDLVIGPDRLGITDPAGRPVYFYLGTRCYLRECGQPGMHPACRRMMDGYRLEPVLQRTVPVRHVDLDRKVRPDQDLDFPWCVAADREMRLGLFRVFPKSEGEGGVASPAAPEAASPPTP